MDKKGQGLPWQVIIVGIIVILVLIVVGVIFTNQNKKFVEGLDKEEDSLQKGVEDEIKGLFGKSADGKKCPTGLVMTKKSCEAAGCTYREKCSDGADGPCVGDPVSSKTCT